MKNFDYRIKLLVALLFFLNTVCVYILLFKNGVIPLGWDTQFHLNRIEELALSLQDGHILPSNGTYAFKQIGLAVNNFYPYIYLYPFSILRNLMNPILAYSVVLSLFTLFSFFLSFFCVSKITRSCRTAVIFSLLFNNSGYLLLQITQRGDLAEYTALIFLPMLFMGFISLFEVGNKNWVFLPIGMILITYAHLLSTGIFSLFLLIFLIMNFQNLTKLVAKKIAVSVFVTLLFVTPIIKNLLEILKNVKIVSPIVPKPLDQEALVLSDLFKNSINNIVPQNLNEVNVGILILIGGIIGLHTIKKMEPLAGKLEIIGIMFFLGSTNVVPWFIFQKTSVNIIQFPWRLLGIATFCFSFVAAYILGKVNINKIPKLYYFVCFVSLLAITFNFMHSYLKIDNFKIYDNQINLYKRISTNAVYADYMPNNAFKKKNRIANFRSESNIHKHEANINGKIVQLHSDQVQSSYNAVQYKLVDLKINKHYVVKLPLLNYGRNFSDNNVVVSSSKQDTTTIKFVAERSVKNVTIRVR